MEVSNDKRLKVGTYTVDVIGLTGPAAHNYELAGDATAILTVTPRMLHWRVEDVLNAEYGTVPTFRVVFDAVVEGDEALLEAVVAAFRGSIPDLEEIELEAKTPPGTYTTVVKELRGLAAENYVLAAEGNEEGTLVINRKKLSIVSGPIYLTYGDMSDGRSLGQFPLPKLEGVLEGDDVSLNRDVFWSQRLEPGEGHPVAGVDLPVGTYVIRPVEGGVGEPLLGEHSDRYELSKANVPSVTLYVEPKTIYFRIGSASVEWGRPLPSLSITFDGVLDGDAASIIATDIRIWQDDLTHYQYVDVMSSGLMDIREYTVTVNALASDDPRSRNYKLDPSSELNSPGRLIVEPRMIDFSILSLAEVTGVYGDPVILNAPGIAGLQLHVGLRLADGNVELKPGAGTYENGAVVYALLGAEADRYRLKPLEQRDTARLVIQKRAITVTLNDFYSYVYGNAAPALPIPMAIHNLVQGDPIPTGFSYQAQKEGTSGYYNLRDDQPLAIPVGTYTVQVTGLDHPNYTLANPGAAAGTTTFYYLPKPVRYRTHDVTIQYGDDGAFFGVAELFEEDIVPGDRGLVSAGLAVVEFRDVLPDRLPVGAYVLVPDGLTGQRADYYVLQHDGSERGLLTVAKRQIMFSQRDLLYRGQVVATSTTSANELRFPYGHIEAQGGPVDRPGSAALALYDLRLHEAQGLLPGDDVRYVIQKPSDLRFSSQGYLAAGTYVWNILLGGSDAGNYEVPGPVLMVVEPRRVFFVRFESEPLMYGDRLTDDVFRIVLDFDGDDGEIFADAAFDVGPLVIRSLVNDFEIAVDELRRGGPVERPAAGLYGIALLDEQANPLRGTDAENFVMVTPPSMIFGSFQVDRRPITLMPPQKTEFVYGVDVVTWYDLFRYAIPADPNLPYAFLDGDQVRIRLASPAESGTMENGWRVDENGDKVGDGPALEWAWAPVEINGELMETWVLGYARGNASPGTYGYFEFRLEGRDAENYELIQPTYTIRFLPKPVRPFEDIYQGTALPVRPSVAERIYQETGVQVQPIFVRSGRSMYGEELHISKDQLAWQGDDCCAVFYRDDEDNLVPLSQLQVGLYPIDRLVLVGPDAWKYTIDLQVYPGSSLRLTHLQIKPREILYSIANVEGQYGNFLACDDPRWCNGGRQPDWSNVWVPGLTTGEVTLEGVLEGDDVRPGKVLLIDLNGRTGTLDDVPYPGLKAHDALYVPTWGFVSYHPGLDTWVSGFSAELWIQDRMLDVRPKLAFYWFDPTYQFSGPDYWVGINQAYLSKYPGMHWIMVSSFEGEYGKHFIPFPWDYEFMGVLTVFPDTTLGLDFVEGIEYPFGGPLMSADRARALMVQLEEAERLAALEEARQRAAEQAEQGQAGEETAEGDDAEGQAAGEQSSQPDDEPVDTVDIAVRRAGARGLEGPSLAQFGAEIDYEMAFASDVTSKAYAQALVEFGVTGVTLKAESGVAVVYQFGQGYVRAGADASASVGLEVTAAGVEFKAGAEAGVSAGAGVEGEIFDGVTGHAEAEAGVMAVAEVTIPYGFHNGVLTLGAPGVKLGAGPQAGTSMGFDTGGIAVDAGVTVLGPGYLAFDAPAFGFGIREGRLVFSYSFSGAFGLFGFDVTGVVAIDPIAIGEAVADFFSDIDDFVLDTLCEVGLRDCETYEPSPWDLGREQLRRAMEIEDPLERAAFLKGTSEWQLMLDDPEWRAQYFRAQQLLDDLGRLETTLNQYLNSQRQLREEFLDAVRNNPAQAIALAQEIAFDKLYGDDAGYSANMRERIQRDLDLLGLRLVQRGGTVTFEWTGGR